MEHALILKDRAKCIVLHIPVELGSGQSATHCHGQAVLEVSTRCYHSISICHFPCFP